jgi:hypothetical protein
VRRPLQLDHHKWRELVSAPASSAHARRGGHRLTILRDGIVRIARYLDVRERTALRFRKVRSRNNSYVVMSEHVVAEIPAPASAR